MLAKFSAWLDNRSGIRTLMSVMLIEHIPGGAKWRYVWGSCLAFVFAIQLLTGILLMTAYSPSSTTAWSSVYFIQYQMDFGWLIRGLHHFGSQTMVVLLGLHMLQVVIAGAHLAPRELNWWLGLLLMGCVLALSLTGYLLPWDQKGFWATQVATNIAGNLPGLGSWIQKIVVGGPAYGHHTLTRFYALHVGILPPLVIVLIIAHLAVFRRHGVTVSTVTLDEEKARLAASGKVDAEKGGWFWPDQAFRDLIACLVIFGIMLTLVLVGHGVEAGEKPEGWYESMAHAGRLGMGANLDAPADPSQAYPARPEWYFLFLFQLLKYFEGEQELLGTVVIPNGVFVLLAILPLLGYGSMRRVGHAFGVLVVTALLVGAGTLTCLALADDMVDAEARWLVRQIGLVLLPLTGAVLLLHLALLGIIGVGALRKVVNLVGTAVVAFLLLGTGALLYGALTNQTEEMPEFVRSRLEEDPAPEKVHKFQEEREKADQAAERALKLAVQGIPAEGAGVLLQRDPMIQGPVLFQQKCAVCHSYVDLDAKQPSGATAPNLKGFGSEEWIFQLLLHPGDEKYFGSKLPVEAEMESMTDFIESNFFDREIEGSKDQKDLRTIAKWLAMHPRKNSPHKDTEEFKKGFKTFQERGCSDCHKYEGEGGRQGADLTGYGDAEWIRQMILLPFHSDRYGTSNRMPAFRDKDSAVGQALEMEAKRVQGLLIDQLNERKRRREEPKIKAAYQFEQLTDLERELIIRWMVDDGRTVFGGQPISGPPRKEDKK